MSKNKFARKQLTKHGWTEGSGLGKNGNGIKDAIKVNLKHDTAGVGHNKGDEFTFQWWDHVFNKAASSISVRSSDDGVAVEKIKDIGPVSNKKRKTYDNKAMLYGQFVKGATLTNGSEDHINEGVESSEDEEEKKIELNRLMDDKMLEICGGMTAHKAARHGLKLSAKMARVMEQEKQQLKLLKKVKETKESQGRKRTRSETMNEINIETVDNCLGESEKRKKKKKKKDKEKEEIHTDDNNIELQDSTKKKKKEKQTLDENSLIDSYQKAVSCDHKEQDNELQNDMDKQVKEKSKKKKKDQEKLGKTRNSDDSSLKKE